MSERTFTEAEIVRNANCQRDGYSPDKCLSHNRYWPYDERACNAVVQILGYKQRVVLGDGRASGEPNLPLA